MSCLSLRVPLGKPTQVKECPELVHEREAHQKLVRELESRIQQFIQKLLQQDDTIRENEERILRLTQENARLRSFVHRTEELEQQKKDLLMELDRVNKDVDVLRRWKQEKELESASAQAAQQNEVLVKTQLEHVSQDVETLQRELIEATDRYVALRKRLDEREAAYSKLKEINARNEAEIAKLQQVLAEKEYELKLSQTLFAHGQSLKRSAPSIPEAERASVLASRPMGAPKDGEPQTTVAPHHHGYHTAPSCKKFEDVRHVLRPQSAGSVEASMRSPTKSPIKSLSSRPFNLRSPTKAGSPVKVADAMHAAKYNLALSEPKTPNVSGATGLGCETYEGPNLVTSYRDAAKLCTAAHEAWLAAGGVDAEPRRIHGSALVIPEGTGPRAAKLAEEFDSDGENSDHAHGQPSARRRDTPDEGLTIFGHPLRPKPRSPAPSGVSRRVSPSSPYTPRTPCARSKNQTYTGQATDSMPVPRRKRPVPYSADPESGSSNTYPHYPSKAGVGRTERVEPVTPTAQREPESTSYDTAKVRLSDGEHVPPRRISEHEKLQEEVAKLREDADAWQRSKEAAKESARRAELYKEMFPQRQSSEAERQLGPATTTALVHMPALDPGTDQEQWFKANSAEPLFDAFGKPAGFKTGHEQIDLGAFGAPYLFTAMDLTEAEREWWQTICEEGRCGLNCPDHRNCRRRAEYIRARNAAPRDSFNMRAYLPPSYPFPDQSQSGASQQASQGQPGGLGTAPRSASYPQDTGMHSNQSGSGVGLQVGVTVRKRDAENDHLVGAQASHRSISPKSSYPRIETPDEAMNRARSHGLRSQSRSRGATTVNDPGQDSVQVATVLKPGGSGRLTVRIGDQRSDAKSNHPAPVMRSEIEVNGPVYAFARVNPSVNLHTNEAHEFENERVIVADSTPSREAQTRAEPEIPSEYESEPAKAEPVLEPARSKPDEISLTEAINTLTHQLGQTVLRGITNSARKVPSQVSASTVRAAAGLATTSVYPRLDHVLAELNKDDESASEDRTSAQGDLKVENPPSLPKRAASQSPKGRRPPTTPARSSNSVRPSSAPFGSTQPKGKVPGAHSDSSSLTPRKREPLKRQVGSAGVQRAPAPQVSAAIQAAKARLAEYEAKRKDSNLNARLAAAEAALEARKAAERQRQLKRRLVSDSRPVWERLTANQNEDTDDESIANVVASIQGRTKQSDRKSGTMNQSPSVTAIHRSLN